MTLLADLFAEVDAKDVLTQIEEDSNKGGGFEPLLKNEYKLTGNEGSVILRILPPLKTFHNPSSPYQELQRHFMMFQGTIYDSLCPGFFNDDCAVCSFIREHGINKKDSTSPYKIFNQGDFENKIPRFRALEEFYVNVYVVDDKQDPKNNGRIFQYKMPYSLTAVFKETYKGNPDLKEKPNDPTNLKTGQNLYIRYQIGKNGFRNYDGSKFLSPSEATDNFDVPLATNKDFVRQIQEGLVQDLYELANPETRLYSKEKSYEVFGELMISVDEYLNGGNKKGGSSRLDDAYAEAPTKKSTPSTKILDSELSKLTDGELDTKQNEDLNALMEVVVSVDSDSKKSVGEDHEDELSSLMAELDKM